MKQFYLTLCLLTGCAIAPLKPGTGRISITPPPIAGKPSAPIISSDIKQPENPKDSAKQEVERRTETTLPDGTKIVQTDRAASVVGAAQKDTGREIAAKLSSLKGVVWLGVFVFLFGVASAFYPPLKLIVGSTTTSAACAAAGTALIVLPSLLVGHELLIICIAVGAVGIYWFAHTHGKLRGTVETLLKKV